MKTKLTILLSATMMMACGPKTIDPEGMKTNDDIRTTSKVLQLTNEEQVIHQAHNNASFQLFKKISSSEDSNVFVSPLSVHYVCAMLANGAQDATQQQLLKAIGMGDYTESEMNSYFAKLIATLPELDTKTHVHIANALWADFSFEVKSDYKQAVEAQYGATIDNLNLADGASADVINQWAEEHTEGMIKNVVNPSQFTPLLRMIIANALFFKGKWADDFQKECTYPGTFYAKSGATEVDMMHNTLRALVTPSSRENAPQLRLLRLPYKGDAYCMDIVLPQEGVNLDEVLDTLSYSTLEQLQADAYYKEVMVQLPKWKAEYMRTLNDDMKALGMEDVFSPTANLSRLSAEPGLYLGSLFQKAYVEVDEEGTKAAAVTIGMVETTSVEPCEPEAFYADRPFLYFIREKKYGTILFAGKMDKPV